MHGWNTCRTCNGSGVQTTAGMMVACRDCNGLGRAQPVREMPPFELVRHIKASEVSDGDIIFVYAQPLSEDSSRRLSETITRHVGKRVALVFIDPPVINAVRQGAGNV